MPPTTNYSFPLAILLLSTFFLNILSQENRDPCRVHTSCASCTGARYHYLHSPDVHPRRRHLRHDETTAPLKAMTSQTNANGMLVLDGGGIVLERMGLIHEIPVCVWCPADGACSSSTSFRTSCRLSDEHHGGTNSDHFGIKYEYNCPLSPPYPSEPPSLLPNWMGTFLNKTDGRFVKLTLLDISLPGTHDSLTYDLSLTISESGLDKIDGVADILHDLSGGTIKILSDEIEEFFRLQAKTQQLSITEQLDNGIRFIDFRLMMEHENKAWYSIHFMQSKHRVETYMQQIRDWIDMHPDEIIVIWFSRHGSTERTGNRQYPNVAPEQKRALWKAYLSIFDGVLINTHVSQINRTSVGELVQRNHRVVTYVSDYEEFTGSSPYAYDAAHIDNFVVGGGVFDEPKALENQRLYFENAAVNNLAAKMNSGFTLMGMNTPTPSWQLINAAKNRLLPRWLRGDIISCASEANIPGMENWCPETLLDIAQLGSYYNQISIENAFLSSISDTDGTPGAFPNAFYLDALDYDGTIRTGTQLLFGAERTEQDSPHKVARYAYVDTVLAYNARVACGAEKEERSFNSRTFDGGEVRDVQASQCNALMTMLEERRSKYPLQLWEEPEYGRHENWPSRTQNGYVAPGSSQKVRSVMTTHRKWFGGHFRIVFPDFSVLNLFTLLAGDIKSAFRSFINVHMLGP